MLLDKTLYHLTVLHTKDFKQLMTREQYDSYLEKVANDYALE